MSNLHKKASSYVTDFSQHGKLGACEASYDVHEIDPGRTVQSTQKQQESLQTADLKREETDQRRLTKPPYTYVALIATAIMNSEYKKLTLPSIHSSLAFMFPYFRAEYKGWKSSVRHTLSHYPCFIKESANVCGVRGNPHFWSVDFSKLPRDTFRRKSLNKDRQYALYLHDELGLPELRLPTVSDDCNNENIQSVEAEQYPKRNSNGVAYNPHSITKILNIDQPGLSDVSSSAYNQQCFPAPQYHNQDMAQQNVQNMYAGYEYPWYGSSAFSSDVNHTLNSLAVPCQSSVCNYYLPTQTSENTSNFSLSPLGYEETDLASLGYTQVAPVQFNPVYIPSDLEVMNPIDYSMRSRFSQ